MTVVTRGSTYDNLPNLAPGFIARMRERYEGTRLGRQELYAELLEDVPGALWTHGLVEGTRVAAVPCELYRIVVAIDPAVTSNEDSNETGILVAGLGADSAGARRGSLRNSAGDGAPAGKGPKPAPLRIRWLESAA
jgi:phage terminase large subunit-like protein